MQPDVTNSIPSLEAGTKEIILEEYAPASLCQSTLDQTTIPLLAKNDLVTAAIEQTLPCLPTTHVFRHGDARKLQFLCDNSIELVVTSPPYWNLKKYADSPNQMGDIDDYGTFLRELKQVWQECYRVLVPGGRLVCVVGDVCLSRRQNNGRHTVVPLHASIQEQCREIGFDNLAPIIWHKIANASREANGNGGGFLGKPYEPNSIIKNDIEFILMERKPGGYRSPGKLERLMSVIPQKLYQQCFRQIWSDVVGASTRQHPAPFPEELARRLIRMFSFVGDTVLDPFLGSGTTSVSAWQSGRNSIGIETDAGYLDQAVTRFQKESAILSSNHTIEVVRESD